MRKKKHDNDDAHAAENDFPRTNIAIKNNTPVAPKIIPFFSGFYLEISMRKLQEILYRVSSTDYHCSRNTRT